MAFSSFYLAAAIFQSTFTHYSPHPSRHFPALPLNPLPLLLKAGGLSICAAPWASASVAHSSPMLVISPTRLQLPGFPLPRPVSVEPGFREPRSPGLICPLGALDLLSCSLCHLTTLPVGPESLVGAISPVPCSWDSVSRTIGWSVFLS